MRRTVSRRRRHGLGTGAAVNSTIRRTRMALVAAATDRARDGDEDALRLLYLLYADNVFGYVLAIVHDEHDAEDVTSEVFARLPRALSHYRLSATPFAAWLLRVARNAALDSPASAAFGAAGRGARQHRRRPNCTPRERLDDLRAALDSLPEDQRQVMLLRLDRRARRRARWRERLGRSVDAMHALQHRARRRLRDELTQAGWAPTALAA